MPLAVQGEDPDGRRRRNLARVLRPRHVAVIGGDAADEALRQLDAIGFAGPVWPVNPRRRRMQGRRCVARVADLPEAPDAAVVAVPAPACPDVFAALDVRGAGGGICFAAGFAEDGAGALEQRLLEAAGDCVLVGPNCHGILNCLDRVALWPDAHGAEPAERGFALVSQSGNVALSATFQQRSAPLAYVIGTGNQAQLGIEDFIEALLDDPRVRAIGLFIEALRDPGRFARATRRALAAGVPVVALKVGSSTQGARASHSHTAALSGSDAAHEALFERLGIRRVATPAELLETLKLLSVSGPLAGRRVLSLSCSGGEAALMGDLLARAGLQCPQPADAAGIAERFGIATASVGNPLDYNTRTWGDLETSARGFEAALAEGHDAAVLVLDFPPPGRARPDNWRCALDAFVRAQGRSNAAVLASLPEGLPATARETCLAAGVAPLQGLEEGVRALAHAAAWNEHRARLLAEAPWDGPLPGPAAGAACSLDESASKAWLAAHGLPVPAAREAGLEALGEAAAATGFPVVLKAIGPGLEHKTELGAVVLGLGSREEVMDAARRIDRRLRAHGRPARHWRVERMVTDAVAELIVGVVRDPVAGLLLVLGSGGVLAELLNETRTLVLPAGDGEIRRALESLPAERILAGHRGGAGGDLDAAVAACASVARFATDHAERLLELDINPLLVRPPGCGALAVDAFIRCAGDAGGAAGTPGALPRSEVSE